MLHKLKKNINGLSADIFCCCYVIYNLTANIINKAELYITLVLLLLYNN